METKIVKCPACGHPLRMYQSSLLLGCKNCNRRFQGKIQRRGNRGNIRYIVIDKAKTYRNISEKEYLKPRARDRR